MTDSDYIAACGEWLRYEPDTGKFFRAGRPRPGTTVGRECGTRPNSEGYGRVWVLGELHYCHRLAWLLTYGHWPLGEIDHINGNRLDNRIANLRDVPPQWNKQNQRPEKAFGSSGLLGASWREARQKWVAQIRIGAKVKHLGYFDTADEAHVAYIAAKRRHHPGCLI